MQIARKILLLAAIGLLGLTAVAITENMASSVLPEDAPAGAGAASAVASSGVAAGSRPGVGSGMAAGAMPVSSAAGSKSAAGALSAAAGPEDAAGPEGAAGSVVGVGASASDSKSETVAELEAAAIAAAYQPGQVVPEVAVAAGREARFFQNVALPDTIFSLMKGKTYKSDCTVPRSDLRYLLCLHRDAKGRAVVGEIIVNRKIAATVLDILYELYRGGYPIERMRLMDYWDGVDERGMRANNSSGFNFRYISHTKRISKHGLGLAVDINPLYNPYRKVLSNGQVVVEPATATPYLNRNKSFPHKIVRGDLCYRLFTEHGFIWGGDWAKCKDYQHFEWRE